ncbi:succinylglutamate desuccinylase/aspartoacylase family protein [Prolixibacteraceae bacterium Z1-6]|uniref:Succinylglutamate desuccinylase/aspartoacylase family protein n=1 Tax=Draconibacterium aestuarii TaxID=2998507 RepID=A0A9X3F8A7_9BACT|nr:succinylglutamate desuccinylase/aspartoacylase family protein [Prolixibacteraceae bacterium Z1-6]
MRSTREISILGEQILPGKKYILNLDIARLHTQTKIEIPVIIERGRVDGPVLLLNAGIHGNELNGVEIVRELLARKYTRPQKGMVICIPTLNVFGFLNQKREFPDGKDLNRSFPGSKSGSLASIFAATMMNEIVPHMDYCVDFHTGGARRFNSSQIRIARDSPELLTLANVFNSRFIVYASQREKSFRQAANLIGKKVLLFEGGKSLDFNQRITRRGVNGTLKLMHHLGMRDFSNELAEMKTERSIVIEKSIWLRAKYGGLFRFFQKDGAWVKKGDLIGIISDPYGKFEYKIKIPQDGYIIGLNHAPVVYKGDAILHLGFE